MYFWHLLANLRILDEPSTEVVCNTVNKSEHWSVGDGVLGLCEEADIMFLGKEIEQKGNDIWQCDP